MDNMNKQEMISALADGQLEGEALSRAIAACGSDDDARECWRRYHLIGDVMRSADLAAATPSEAFLARLRVSLAREQVARPGPLAAEVRPIEIRPAAQAASNDPRWKLVAGVSTMAAVAAIGWSVLGGSAAGNAGPQLAAVPPAAVLPAVASAGASAQKAPLMLRDERLDRLLAAHRQFGGAGAVPTAASFMRNAAFEGPSR